MSAEPKRITWVAKSGRTEIGPYYVVGGVEDNNPVYVIRAKHDKGCLVGKLPTDGKSGSAAYVSYYSQEHRKTEYEIMTCPRDTLSWVPMKSGEDFPDNPVVGGTHPDGSELYIGRGIVQNQMLTGYIYKPLKNLYVGHYGKEYPSHNFEILIKNKLGLKLGV